MLYAENVFPFCPENVLSFCKDPVLSKTRCAVLATQFRVARVESLQELRDYRCMEEIDVFVLCHSLSAAERSRASALARQNRPGSDVLVLQTQFTGGSFEEDERTLEYASPASLLAAVAAMVRHRGSGLVWSRVADPAYHSGSPCLSS